MILLGGLALFHPSPPDSDTYYMQWRMRFRNMDVYEGEVLSSRIGPLSLRGGRIAETDSVRSMLFTEPLVVEGIAGPPPRRTAPIISIYDREQRQVMLLGARGEDLVYRYRARGDRFLVDRVTVRVADAFAGLSEGEPFRLDWRADARGYCLELDQTRRCGHGLTVGDTWSIVHFIDRPPAERAVIQAIWLWMAFIPGGLAVATPLSLAGATVLAAGTLLAGAPLLGFAVTPLHQVLGAALGLVTGAIVRRVLRGDSRSDKLLSRNLERLSERV